MNDNFKHTDIVVIGAGLTGLTLSWYLRKYGKDFITLEKTDRVGGYINTQKKGDFLYESGPNTGVLSNPEIIELFEDLSDVASVEVAGTEVNKRYVLKNGRWHAMPMSLGSAIKTPLFTTLDKLRILAEPIRPKGTNEHENLSSMVKRRLGNSFLDYAVDPFILGIYAGDPEYLIPKYALPKLYNLENTYGSFILGSMKIARERKKDPRWNKVSRYIFSFQGGLSKLTDALYLKTGKESFILNSQDVTVSIGAEGFVVSYIQNGTPKQIRCNKVITTSGAYTLNSVLPFIDRSGLDKLTKLKYARVIEASLGFKRWKGFVLDGFGGLIPHKEGRNLLGILFLSAFLKNRSPKDGALMTIFMGGIRNEELVDLPDSTIEKIISDEVKDLMDLKEFSPDLFEFKRFNHAIPQYGVDTGDRLKTIEDIQGRYPGLIIAGNIRDGIGMADRIKQARMIADSLK